MSAKGQKQDSRTAANSEPERTGYGVTVPLMRERNWAILTRVGPLNYYSFIALMSVSSTPSASGIPTKHQASTSCNVVVPPCRSISCTDAFSSCASRRFAVSANGQLSHLCRVVGMHVKSVVDRLDE